MVARAILIESKKDKCVNTAWNITNKESLEPVMAKWLEGSDTMEYVNCNREESGSKITLVLKPKYAMKLTMQGLVGGIRKWMLYQPFPVEVMYDKKREVLYDSNWIMDNPFADILGVISIRILDDLKAAAILRQSDLLIEDRPTIVELDTECSDDHDR